MFKQITEIENRITKTGQPIAVILKEANMARSTLCRWRNKQASPTLSAIDRLDKAIQKFEKPKRKQKAKQ